LISYRIYFKGYDYKYPIWALWGFAPKDLHYLAFQSFDFEST
jgi:hypothetical protein